MRRPPFPEFFATADEVVSSLHANEWVILVAAARPRSATDPPGNQITIHDAVVTLQRRT